MQIKKPFTPNVGAKGYASTVPPLLRLYALSLSTLSCASHITVLTGSATILHLASHRPIRKSYNNQAPTIPDSLVLIAYATIPDHRKIFIFYYYTAIKYICQ